MTVYQKINDAVTQNGLWIVVENYLDEINQNNPSETYEETSERLRDAGLTDEAEVMDYAAAKWHGMER